MNDYDSAFLGYDIRIDPELVRGEWSRERRLTYLLNPEIDIPLSIDTLCWPSVFKYGRQGQSDPIVNSDAILVTPSGYYQTALRFWTKVADMQKAIPPHKSGTTGAIKVFSREPLFDNGF